MYDSVHWTIYDTVIIKRRTLNRYIFFVEPISKKKWLDATNMQMHCSLPLPQFFVIKELDIIPSNPVNREEAYNIYKFFNKYAFGLHIGKKIYYERKLVSKQLNPVWARYLLDTSLNPNKDSTYEGVKNILEVGGEDSEVIKNLLAPSKWVSFPPDLGLAIPQTMCFKGELLGPPFQCLKDGEFTITVELSGTLARGIQ